MKTYHYLTEGPDRHTARPPLATYAINAYQHYPPTIPLPLAGPQLPQHPQRRLEPGREDDAHDGEEAEEGVQLGHVLRHELHRLGVVLEGGGGGGVVRGMVVWLGK